MQTISSIVSPAEKSAVVGFKPSKGLIPSTGIIYGSQQQDTVGILTRNVRDAARILKEILRHTSDHATSANKALQNIDNALKSCDTNLSHVRIGNPGDIGVLFDISKIKREAFEETLSLLQETGAKVVRNISIAGAKEYEDLPQASKQIILDTDLKLSVDYYLSTLQSNPHKLKRLEDVIEVTKRIEAEEYPERDIGGFERAAKTDPDNELYKSLIVRDNYFIQEGGIAGAIERHNLNVLLMPTASMTMSTFAAKAGSPVMSVPMGFFPDGTKVEHDPRNGFVDVAPNIP
jgi:amidase